TVVGANRSLAVSKGIPGDADRRPEIVPIVVVELAGNPLERARGNQSKCYWLVGHEIREIVEMWRQACIEAQAEINCEIRPELPRVLSVEFVLRPATVNQIEAAGGLEGIQILCGIALLDLSNASQEIIDCRLQSGLIVRVDGGSAGYFESS